MTAPTTTHQADEALVRRDPVLGRLLPLVLSPAALGATLEAEVRIDRVRYKHGRSAVAAWTSECETAFGRHGLVVVQSDTAKAAKTVEAARRTAAPTRTVEGSRDRAVVTGVLGDRTLARTLARLLRGRPELLDGAELLRHNPFRRQVWKVQVDGAPHVLRIGRNDVAARRRALHDLAASGLPLVVPTSLPTPTSELLPWWGRGDLAVLPSGETASCAAWAAGRAVLALHRSTSVTPDLRPGGAGLTSVVGTAAVLAPETSARVSRLVRDVSRRVAEGGGRPVPLHGDLSADQVLVDDVGAVRLVDLDRLRTGPAERDLGSFAAAAHLEERPDLPPALLAGYADAGGTWAPSALDAWTAHGLLTRLAEPFRRRDPRWRARWDATLDAVEDVLR